MRAAVTIKNPKIQDAGADLIYSYNLCVNLMQSSRSLANGLNLKQISELFKRAIELTVLYPVVYDLEEVHVGAKTHLIVRPFINQPELAFRVQPIGIEILPDGTEVSKALIITGMIVPIRPQTGIGT